MACKRGEAAKISHSGGRRGGSTLFQLKVAKCQKSKMP
jgi:hypothetical protein